MVTNIVSSAEKKHRPVRPPKVNVPLSVEKKASRMSHNPPCLLAS
jgi:hypothetical protein